MRTNCPLASTIPTKTMSPYFIFILVFNLAITRSNGDTSQPPFTSCSTPASCGAIINIGYPFWGVGRPSFCGRPEFQLLCPTNSTYPSILIGINAYRVLKIHSENQTITLAGEEFTLTNTTCSPAPLIYTLNDKLFSFKNRNDVVNLTFLYGYQCPKSIPKNIIISRFKCSNGNLNATIVYNDSSFGVGCNGTSIEVPVFSEALKKLKNNTETLLGVLNEGFTVGYKMNVAACHVCMSSGGACGSSLGSLAEFVCYCPHGTAFATPCSSGKRSAASTIGSVVSVTVVCLILVIIICLYLRQRRKGKKTNNDLGLDDDITSFETLKFKYDDIKDATENFAEANKLGRGGFGIVYKGVLENGQQIAVKRLSRNSGQGEAEFRTEVLLVAKLQHRNLVRLLGFSLAGDERLLIYEYVPNASLDHFLFGNTRHETLDWHIRYKIIGGIARGLLYLHEDSRIQIIHRDLKASNILLDAHLNPKIADFGLARLFQADQTHADTKKIAGTFGYMAPEYAYCGVFSVKSDVYSFGVLVLEIICGQKNFGFQEDGYMKGLVTSVWRKWTEEKAFDLVDSALVFASRVEIMRCIHISLLCVQADPANRPTMSLVNLMLSSESHSLPLPSEPAFVVQTNFTLDSLALRSRVEEESITKLQGR